MLVRPDAPLDARPAAGGTSVLRDARLSVESAEAHAEREPSTGPQLHGGPLLRTPTDLIATSAEVGGGDVIQAATAAASFDGGAVVVGRTADVGPTVVRVSREGEVSGGMPVVGAGASVLLGVDYFGKDPGNLDRFIGYVAVPVSAQGERGQPLHFSVKVKNARAGGDPDVPAEGDPDDPVTQGAPSVRLLANGQCSHVDVYKTHTLDDQGEPYQGRSTAVRRALFEGSNPILQTAVKEGLLGDFDVQATAPARELFFLKRVRVTPVPDDDDPSVTAYVVDFEDRTTFLPAADTLNPETGEADLFEGRYTTGGIEFNELVVPTEAYDVPRLAASHAYHTGQPGGDVAAPGGLEESGLEFSAGAALPFQGRLLFGAPEWPTLRPALILQTEDTDTGLDMRLAFEYDDNGVAVLGPDLAVANPGKLVALARGAEVALRVYVLVDDGEGGTDRKLYERVTASSTGVFVSGFGGDRTGLTFDSAEYSSARLSDETDGPAGGPLDAVDTITEPRAVFVSSPNRPREVTYGQFRAPQGSEVRLLAPARLAEAEGLRQYSAYLGSDTGVWTIRREGDAFVTEDVATTWGVALAPQIRADRGQSAALVPVVCPVPSGLVVYGTDGHLHLLSGRQDVLISAPISRLIERVLSLAFDPRRSHATNPDGDDLGPLVWALVEDAADAPGSAEAFGGTGRSLFAYSTQTGAWVAHRTVPTTTDGLFYDDPELGGDGLMVVGQDGDTLLVDGSGSQRTTSLWASGDLPTNHVQAVKADVNGGVYDPAEKVALRASWRHPKVVQVGAEAEPGQILREASVAHGRPFHPRARGGGIRVSVAGFEVLRGLEAGG